MQNLGSRTIFTAWTFNTNFFLGLTTNFSEIFEDCSKSNISLFIMLAHSIRGRWWWYGSTGSTFLPMFCYTLLLCNRWQQRGRLTKWHLTWKCRWSKDMSLNSYIWKKWHLLTFTDVSTVRWWVVCFSSGDNVTSTCSDFNEHSMQAFVVKIHSYSWWLC